MIIAMPATRGARERPIGARPVGRRSCPRRSAVPTPRGALTPPIPTTDGHGASQKAVRVVATRLRQPAGMHQLREQESGDQRPERYGPHVWGFAALLLPRVRTCKPGGRAGGQSGGLACRLCARPAGVGWRAFGSSDGRDGRAQAAQPGQATTRIVPAHSPAQVSTGTCGPSCSLPSVVRRPEANTQRNRAIATL